ncbi:hypothetical protein [Klebsiella pneumoniae]|uniref:hypothetical protein n=1 Tax=Klebsiella pneumoniae TaxID=573 RepID=UPI0022B72275|nr:hypothetical protein [Klebsiella pneumoniae]
MNTLQHLPDGFGGDIGLRGAGWFSSLLWALSAGKFRAENLPGAGENGTRWRSTRLRADGGGPSG